MDRLPLKVLAKILGFVPRNDKLRLFRVSKKWYRVMDQMVGIDITIGRGVNIFMQDVSVESSWLLKKVGVRVCELDSFINDSEDVPKLKHPDLLRVITFKNFVSSRTFESILTGVTNLHTFELDETAIFHLDFSELNFCLPCQVFRIKYAENWGSDEGHDLADHQTLALSTVHLFRNSFPGLKTLDVTLFILIQIYGIITAAIESCLLRHSETLTSVSVLVQGSGGRWTEAEFKHVGSFASSPVLDEQQRQELPLKNLQHINIKDYVSRCSTDPPKPDWMKWALHADNVETLSVTNNIPQFNLTSIIMKNAASLKEILIRFGCSSQMDSFDCALLKDCKKLSVFHIFLNGKTFTSIGRKTPSQVPPGLINVQFLPKTLVQLYISGLPVTCQSCEIMLRQLPELEELTIDRIPYSLGYGVPVNVAQEILRQKKLKKFDIVAGSGTTEESFSDLVNRVYKVSNRRITGMLGRNGEYSLRVIEDPPTSFPSNVTWHGHHAFQFQ